MNEDNLVMVKGNKLLDTTIIASLTILLSNARATHMHKMLGPDIRVVVTKAMLLGPLSWLWSWSWAGLWLSPCNGCP